MQSPTSGTATEFSLWCAYMIRGHQAFIVEALQGILGSPDADRIIAQARESAIRDLKNTDTTGAPIDMEAKVLGQAIKDIEKAFDDGLAQARERHELRKGPRRQDRS